MAEWSPDLLEPIVPAALDHPALPVAIQAAKLAGRIIADYYHQGVEVRHKGIGELVTNADMEAEQAILRTIRDSFPGHAIMAEETIQVAAESDDLWIVDPLDGTNNFAHHIPHFAVSIGYYRAGRPACGVIVNPMTGDWFFTVKGQGAWFQKERCQVNSASRLDETMIALGFYYDRGAMMEATLDAIRDFFRQNIHGVRRFGTASLDLAMLGRGFFGSYFEYQLSPWDHAAGRLFVEEAGGKVTDCEGNPLPIYRKSSILASNGLLHDASLAIASQHWLALQSRLNSESKS